ncbi:MAG: hypothetical protein HC802_12685 [Caldilineaceae bacterium]|nr:hypothetical protein [Caldilineaceae bacterium]
MDDDRRNRLIDAARAATEQHLAQHPPGVTRRGAASTEAAAQRVANEIAADLLLE